MGTGSRRGPRSYQLPNVPRAELRAARGAEPAYPSGTKRQRSVLETCDRVSRVRVTRVYRALTPALQRASYVARDFPTACQSSVVGFCG